MTDNKTILKREQEQEAVDFLQRFAEADLQEQRDALAFIRGVQFGKALTAETDQKGA